MSAPDPDVLFDLQALLHRVYDAADYGKYIYGETPQPPLIPADEAWAWAPTPILRKLNPACWAKELRERIEIRITRAKLRPILFIAP